MVCLYNFNLYNIIQKVKFWIYIYILPFYYIVAIIKKILLNELFAKNTLSVWDTFISPLQSE